MTIEEEVQKLGDLFPVMGPERWEESVRPAIVKYVAGKVHQVRNQAQAMVMEQFMKHERALDLERAKHQAELEALQQLLLEALQGQPESEVRDDRTN